jgi:hypothetical protein
MDEGGAMSAITSEVMEMQARLEADLVAVESARTEAARAARAERQRALDTWRGPRMREAERIAEAVAGWERLVGDVGRARARLWLTRAVRARQKGQGHVLGGEAMWRQRHLEWVQLSEVVKSVQDAVRALQGLEVIPGPVEAAAIDRRIAAGGSWAGVIGAKWAELVAADGAAVQEWEVFTATAPGAQVVAEEAADG